MMSVCVFFIFAKEKSTRKLPWNDWSHPYSIFCEKGQNINILNKEWANNMMNI